MGYTLQTDSAPRKSTPGGLRASPKTHTPGPRLQQRGFRYYSPELGRWLSRDPIGVHGGWAEYGFCANAPITFTDPFGLVWSAPERNYGPRARVTCECGDVVKDLSAMIGLDDVDFKAWLKDEDGWGVPNTVSSPITRKTRVFSVPNTAYVDRGDVSAWYVILRRWIDTAGDQLAADFLAKKYKVVDSRFVIAADIARHLSDENLWAYGYFGHGSAGNLVPDSGLPASIGTFVPSGSIPDTKFGIHTMDLIACKTHDLAHIWDNNVSSRGYLTTVEGWIAIWWPFYFVTTPGDNSMRRAYP